MTNVPVVSYARISADIRRDEHGVQDQHRLNRETAERHGWTVVHEYTDNDKSAAKADVVRDDFEAMLRVLRAGELPDGTAVQGVVIVAEDRLARRPGDYERFVEAITYQDGRVFADARGTKDLYSEDTESMGLFGAVISKMEVRKMQRRMRRSHRTRAEQGLPVGGTRPFGWKPDRLTLDPEEAPLVRQAVLDLIAGRSFHSITNQWRREGAKTSLGNEWTTPSLKLNVQNPRICGWQEINGELVRDPAGNPVVGQWEPIVTPEQWMAVKNIFDARRGHYIHRDGRIGHILTPDFREPNYLLTGFLRCGRAKPDGSLCNTSLRVTHSKDCSSTSTSVQARPSAAAAELDGAATCRSLYLGSGTCQAGAGQTRRVHYSRRVAGSGRVREREDPPGGAARAVDGGQHHERAVLLDGSGA
ncbi:recombinase family protein [Nonomuraea sp. LP-02]|uniref:recombinase family protein n=1 Tax=Nonomuraea sp. LP-02 TaxID=3097960 RepID=UPI002E30BC2B|nr:recombinase family protein [Nonomuraea sp. LP-02]MED7928177.1 recombinase family protein [Nonomuraea sp. LP-02]